jgi:rubrerythrin
MNLPTGNTQKKWRIEDIPFHKIDRRLIADDEFMFHTLAAASFTEILAELYSENLIEHFKGNAEIEAWLRHSWREEEVQHGQSLKKYVQTVWPDFDWERAYADFQVEYGALCTSEQLESDRAMELIARCVVETGTSSFYKALNHYVREPVLRQLLDHIRADEVAHYTHFRRYYGGFAAVKQHGLRAVGAVILRRLAAIESEDAYIAFKHAYIGHYPERPFRDVYWKEFQKTTKRLARRHYPFEMAVKMLIKPVPMSDSFKKVLHWPLVGAARLLSYI